MKSFALSLAPKKAHCAVAVFFALYTGFPTVHAEESGGLNWSAWQRMPVLEDGRIMPLDSYARGRVKKICGEVNPSIGRLGTLTPKEAAALSPDERAKWIKENCPRRFLAAELVYAWTVDPTNWDDVPILYAANTELRTEWLGVPLEGEDGSRLTRVTPRQVHDSKKFPDLVNEVQALEQEAQQKKLAPQFTALQQSAKDLAEAYILFEQLRFDPARDDGRRWIAGDVTNLSESWQRFHADLLQLPVLEPQPEMFRLAQQTNQVMFKLMDAYRPMQKDPPTLEASDAALGELRRVSSQLSAQVDALAKSKIALNGGLGQGDADEITGDRQIVARSANFVNVESARIRWALYDAGGEGIFVMPALEPTALEADRHRSEMHPWISLRALLEGSPDLLQGYPEDDVRRIRKVWNEARAAYLTSTTNDKGEKDPVRIAERAEKFSEAIQQFAGGVRAVSEEIEPKRAELPIIERDKILLAKTAYPRAFAADAEVFYNRVDPFHWAWIVSLAAAVILGLSALVDFRPKLAPIAWTGGISLFARFAISAAERFLPPVFFTKTDWQTMSTIVTCISVFTLTLAIVLFLQNTLLRTERARRIYRIVTFWIGIPTLISAVLLLAGGFGVRIYITHWAPVTSMFETMVWVAMCVALLTLWATFLPLLGPTSKTAWSWTAIPGTWEDKRQKPPSTFGRGAGGEGDWNGSAAPARAVALTLRAVLFIAGLYIIGVIPAIESWVGHSTPGDSTYGGDYSLVSFLPRTDIGATLPGASSTLVWLASLFVAGTLTWYVPRLIPSALMAIGMSIALARRAESAEAMEKIYSWRVVAMAGALASFLAALAANYAPFPRDIQALMPVLRSNFWLGIHVLTITSSYAAVSSAWVIGNVALGWYIFGRYRTVERRPRASQIQTEEAVLGDSDGDAPEAVTAVAMSQGERRPPAFCGTLANLNYRVVQIAVLLLAAGTILGGLWADVSWGRFWGWDPKEVGALIALLVLLTAVHGRRAGWPGDLTLAIGSVMGFFGVLWAWYVVNFLLNAGLHSYGAGEGGRWVWLVVVVGVQILYILAAVTRVSAETGQRAE
jgi:ABC-type transport system involved in cytochrome c biogenesis permease subunit